ncbi:Tricarboxylate transport protein TctC [plant metagenome]|uniref:Tricarboxylate transport protein TctC n=1 Tax=plant metagenome TaxID=1297885 RepID=A0A484UB21_9ZZZZ
MKNTLANLSRRRVLLALAASPFAASTPALASAAYPNRPIRLVVPFPAGGGVDIFARPLALGLSDALGVPVVIENVGGAASRIGTQRVVNAEPDGYTLMVTNDTLVASDSVSGVAGLARMLPQLQPVTMGISSCNLFVSHPRSGITDPASYLEQLRARDGGLTIGVPGWGTAHHLCSAALNHRLGVTAEHVSYRGGAPLLADVLNGTLNAGVVTMAAAVAHIQAGNLLGLAVTSETRAPALPDVPTLHESIAPGYTHKTWQGVFAPAGLPDDLLQRVHAAVVQALQHPKVQEMLPAQGFDAEGLPSTAFSASLEASLKNFETVVQATGIKAA